MKLTKTCAKFLRKHGGTILAIGASIGVGLTMWETGKATVKATTFVTMNKDEPMAKKEIVKDCWKFYIPAAVVGAGTVACILGSNALNKKQLASMTAAYMALGKTYQEYRREVAERIGAEEEKKLRMEVAEKTKGEDVRLQFLRTNGQPDGKSAGRSGHQHGTCAVCYSTIRVDAVDQTGGIHLVLYPDRA